MLEWIPGQADQRALEQALLLTGSRAWYLVKDSRSFLEMVMACRGGDSKCGMAALQAAHPDSCRSPNPALNIPVYS